MFRAAPDHAFQLIRSDDLEIHLDRKIADRGVFPAIDIQKSGTRKEELLIAKEDLNCADVLSHGLTVSATDCADHTDQGSPRIRGSHTVLP